MKKPVNKHAQALRKLAGDKPQIARWKGKTPEQKRAHSELMNSKNGKWKKHLEKLAKLSEIL